MDMYDRIIYITKATISLKEVQDGSRNGITKIL